MSNEPIFEVQHMNIVESREGLSLKRCYGGERTWPPPCGWEPQFVEGTL